ncbi:CaiB/BaiF CoA transferase family protein [Oharaeibacter diazotrophicus]|uniref:Crotonobetainyl-CoA:carnitine CoA-transferase CaiB-like acyl-CoA transferase n=1 Tax=Oharaeibacter diazotrophicus TaxID=1920512 RepID=A0A4R6RMK8_9HYPH|nr:CoA transferase [Oharaeibacter diazotrophicus]TDP87267.1 crotonobetainyl-CoA:carnitine CoA-transferase CaiB-like acyl-CoA transferase [Oharaeibacter diazotrophicus]BBE70789.1 succinyl-CoA:(R)-benzylsuccinate CoA-transferase subunit BbsF [Pleomorphomonas sp. SM30]GLS77538.1 CoA transferase [Oharaeibacter diazotrophicus]
MDFHATGRGDGGPAATAAGPLAGIRVLDLSRILAGPSATQLLGDLGAEVVKVERPGVGDDTRGWGPPFAPAADGGESDRSAYFLAANRNKRSIALDLKDPADAARVRALARRADVVVENYKTGDLDRAGLGWEALRAENPRLVWCTITGFGLTGPLAGGVGYDFLVQAMGGIMSVTGEPDAAGGRPLKVGVGIADIVCGLYAAIGILAALRYREATGQGQRIDLSLFDAQIAWLANVATGHLVSGLTPRRLGNRHPNIAPYQSFPAADGEFVIACGNDAQFVRLAEIAGLPALAGDPRFALNRGRVANVDTLDAILSERFRTAPRATWVERLERAGVPAGVVATVPEALAHPQTLAREMVVPMTGADGETVRLLGNPLKFSASPVAFERAPPHLDEHRAEILALIGETVAAAG